MKGFLGRVAARAVGEATVVRPRLAHPYGPREAEAPAGLDVARGTGLAPAAQSADEPAAARAVARAKETGREALTTRSTASPVRRGSPVGGREVEDLPAREADFLLPAALPSPVGLFEDPDQPPPSSSTPAAVPATAQPVVPLARATPVVPGPVAAAAAATRAAPDEQPTVRVHIGRLEVRASLEQPAPQPPRREKSRRAPELSLSDYLRGRQAR